MVYEKEIDDMENKKEKKGGSKAKLIIIVILVTIIIVGAGGYFGYTMFFKDKAQAGKESTKTNQQHVVQQVPAQQGATAQQQVQNGVLMQPVVSAKTFGLDEFLINLADEDGKRYVKVKVFLGYDNKKLDAELEEKKPIIRDAIIAVFRTKKAADISPKGVDTIKMELIQKINMVLEKGQLNNIYINDILLQ